MLVTRDGINCVFSEIYNFFSSNRWPDDKTLDLYNSILAFPVPFMIKLTFEWEENILGKVGNAD